MNITKTDSDSSSSKADSPTEVVSSFLKKTFDMLEDGKYSSFVSWSQDGKCVIIHNPPEFARHLLPIFFKHNNLASFIRQLNMYEFKKKKSLISGHIFYHDLFQCGRRDLLKFIHRKNTKKDTSRQKLNSEKSDDNVTRTSSSSDSLLFIEENRILKKLQMEATEKINSLESKLAELNNQNKEMFDNSQRQRKSDSLLKMVISQVACFYGPEAAQNILLTVKSKSGEIISNQVPDYTYNIQQQYLQNQNQQMNNQELQHQINSHNNNNHQFLPTNEMNAPLAYNRGYQNNQFYNARMDTNRQQDTNTDREYQFGTNQPNLSVFGENYPCSKVSNPLAVQQNHGNGFKAPVQEEHSFLSTELSDEQKWNASFFL